MSLTSLAVGVLTFLLLITAQERPVGPTVQTSLPMSPAVFATFIGHGEPSSVPPAQLPPSLPRQKLTGPLTLDLLVLWRGAPGWFLKGGQQAESGGGDDKGRINVHFQRGGIALDLALDQQTRMAHIGGNEVALEDSNVVLVDNVDVPGGLTIAGTRSVDPTVQEDLAIGISAIFRGAPDLIPFLRCETRVDDPSGRPSPAAADYLQQALYANCARIMEK